MESRMKRLRIRRTDWRGVATVHPQSAGERFEREVGQWGCTINHVRAIATTSLAAAVFLFGATLEVTGCAIVALARRLAEWT